MMGSQPQRGRVAAARGRAGDGSSIQRKGWTVNRLSGSHRLVSAAVGVVVFVLTGGPRAAAQPPAAPKADAAPVKPFQIKVDDAVLKDLQERLARAGRPDAIDGSGWEYGVDLPYMKDLVAYWRDGYDWRAH